MKELDWSTLSPELIKAFHRALRLGEDKPYMYLTNDTATGLKLFIGKPEFTKRPTLYGTRYSGKRWYDYGNKDMGLSLKPLPCGSYNTLLSLFCKHKGDRAVLCLSGLHTILSGSKDSSTC